MTRRSETMQITIMRGQAVLARMPLKHGMMTFGRSRPADVILDDAAVSANHAAICLIGGSAWLVDNRSTNGTWLNHRKVGRHSLRHGDKITIGRHTIVVDIPTTMQGA